MIQTPEALVQVDDDRHSNEIFKGKAMMNWQGQLFRKVD
jgi:hypothetical protein